MLVNISGYTSFYDDNLKEMFADNANDSVKLSVFSLTSILRKSSVSDVMFLTLVLQV